MNIGSVTTTLELIILSAHGGHAMLSILSQCDGFSVLRKLINVKQGSLYTRA